MLSIRPKEKKELEKKRNLMVGSVNKDTHTNVQNICIKILLVEPSGLQLFFIVSNGRLDSKLVI